jgi:FkbM family methyltransferase
LFYLAVKNRRIKVRAEIKTTGVKVDVNLGEFVGYWIFMDGSYEEPWIRQVALIVKGKVFFDVGANIGAYTLSLAKEAQRIYAFEPEKLSYSSLVDSLKLNQITNVLAYKIALADRNQKEIPLYINIANRGLSSLKVHYPEGEQTVASVTLDSFIKTHKIRKIGLIKIDVEGSELDVLEGAKDTLLEIGPPILIELNGKILSQAGLSPINIYRTLVKYRYHAYQLRGSELVPFNESEISPTMNVNVLFKK